MRFLVLKRAFPRMASLACLLVCALSVRAEDPVLKIAVMSDIQGMPYAEAARPVGSVLGYRVELAENGGETKSYFHLSDYYRRPEHQQDRIVFKIPPNAVNAGRSYRCRVVPVGFFGKEGASLDWKFGVRSGYPCRADQPNVIPE